MPPAAVSYNSLVINGANGSRRQVMFGDGHQVNTVNLADYRVHADSGHRVFGNGKDYLLDRRGRPIKSIAGWQWFIDQNNYNK